MIYRPVEELQTRIEAQRGQVPSIYQDVDFTVSPERFAIGPNDLTELPASDAQRRTELLSDNAKVEAFRTYTMLGDATADAYSALMAQYGFKQLVEMLDTACRQGIDAVPDAPQELRALIGEMESATELVDIDLARKGADLQRASFVMFAPYSLRGAFFGTFINKYAALPMAITGALSKQTASRRVRETTRWYASVLMPGGLDRYGEGFRTSAMVRVMHSMVRYNLLTRSNHWDVSVYGIPIPQVDSIVTGLQSPHRLAKAALAKGRSTFNADERAQVELARYQCALLGLPHELLTSDLNEIVEIYEMRKATLRQGYDEKTCGTLIRSTMEADLGFTPYQRKALHRAMEASFAKLLFVKSFLEGDAKAAERFGIKLDAKDYAWAAFAGLFVGIQYGAYSLGSKIGPLKRLGERSITRRLKKLYDAYGTAEFTTDGHSYGEAAHSHA